MFLELRFGWEEKVCQQIMVGELADGSQIYVLSWSHGAINKDHRENHSVSKRTKRPVIWNEERMFELFSILRES